MAASKTKTNKATADQTVEKKTAKSADKTGKATNASKKKDAKKNGKPGLITRAKTYFKGVRTEVKRVVWPTKPEMIKYTGAVLGMLVFFGLLIALVDTVIVPVLYAFSGLR